MGYRSCYGNELFREPVYVKDVLELRFFLESLSRGNVACEVEQELENFFSVGYAHLLTNATSGLKSSVMALTPSAGDVVLVPRIGFISVVNLVLSAGLVPVLIDVDDDNHMSVDALSEYLRFSRPPLAVIVAHLDGTAAKIGEILKGAGDIPVIEDCAQSFGVSVGGRYVGTFGRFGCFSFNQNKILSSGEGGLVICNTEEDYKNVVRYSNNGSNDSVNLVFDEKSFFGENYTITEICSSLILYQLGHMDYIKSKLSEHYRQLTALLTRKGLEFKKRNDGDINISVRMQQREAVEKIKFTNVPYVEWKDSDLLKNPIVQNRLSPYTDGYPWCLEKERCKLIYRDDIKGISMLVPLSDEKLEKLMRVISEV